MAYITLLCSVLSFFLIANSADVQVTMVDKYDIDIELYSTNIFHVTCFIVFKNLRTTQQIRMYADNITVRETPMIKKDTDVNLVKNNEYNSTTKILTLFLKEKLDPGLYVMNITFTKIFGLAFNQIYSDHIHEKEVVWLSSTHYHPIWNQRIIPCWVRPKEDTLWRYMPTFNLSILHFAHHSVLTNMPIREERLVKGIATEPDTKRTYFHTIPQMSPYQLSIIMTNFTRIIDEDNVVSMWCRNRSASSLQFALTIAKNITTYLKFNKEWLHWRFSTMRVQLIVIPKVQSRLRRNMLQLSSFPERNDSLVHPGIIIANEDDITYNKENDTVGRKYNVMRLLGYEVVREYYECIVNPYWEPNTWLSKGFATFISTHIFNQILPNFRMTDLFVVQILHECLNFDVDNSMLPFPHQSNTIPVEMIEDMKASVLLRMLQHVCILKSKAFWKAIDTFIYDSVFSKRKRHLKLFWRALIDAHDKTDDMEGLMNLLLIEKGYPVLIVKLNYDNAFVRSMDVSVDFKFRENERLIPISFTTGSFLSFNQTEPSKWIKFTERFHKDFNYNEESWVIFNIQQTGYYRVNYDNENWARISKYLNEDNYLKIHVLNRAQLIDDAFQFMVLDKLKADIFWQLAKYLERETDYIAWYPMFKAIQYMSTTFQSYHQRFYIRRLSSIWQNLDNLLDALFRNINHEDQLMDDDFTKALRQEVTHWTCSLRMSHCRQFTFVKLKLHLVTHTRFSSWWKKCIYCYGLIEADNIIWHQTQNKIRGNDNDKMLYLVTCPNYLVKINNYTSTTYTKDDVKSHITNSTKFQIELRHFVYTIVESLENDKKYENEMKADKTYKSHKIFRNFLHNIEDIKPRQLTFSTAILILFNNIYSPEYLIEVRNAFNEYSNAFIFDELKGIPEYYVREKLYTRRREIIDQDRLFERMKPRN